MRKNKAEKLAAENAAFAAKVAAYMAALDEEFNATGNISDPYEKIIALRAFKNSAGKAKKDVTDLMETLARKRCAHKPSTYAGIAALSPVIAIVGAMALISSPRRFIREWDNSEFSTQKAKSKETAKLRAMVIMDAFYQTINDRCDAADAQINEIIEHGDLRAIAQSPHFEKFHGESEVLRKRFAAAAAKRAVFGDDAAPEQKPPQTAQQASPRAPISPEKYAHLNDFTGK